MATHELDQKLLGRLALDLKASQPQVARALFQLLGLSIMLTPRLSGARRARVFLTTDDRDAVLLLHQIMWLCRTGLQLLEETILPIAAKADAHVHLKVFAAKLRTSFYHVLCLFRNQPPVLLKGPLTAALPSSRSQQRRPARSPSMAPTARMGSRSSPGAHSQPRRTSAEQATARGRLRDPIKSMTSEVSYVTNPYADQPTSPSPVAPAQPLSLPAPEPVPVHDGANYLVASRDYVPVTARAFDIATDLAVSLLPGSAPLRLSVVLEQCAFLWDCRRDHRASRDLARRTIRDVYATPGLISDADFDDARALVAALGRVMRRRTDEETPPPPANAKSFDQATLGLPPAHFTVPVPFSVVAQQLPMRLPDRRRKVS